MGLARGFADAFKGIGVFMPEPAGPFGLVKK